jgi:hypothetical protein
MHFRSSPFVAPLRRLLALACTGVMVMTLAAPLRAATPEEQAVIAPFQNLLDAIAKRDKELMREQLLPGGIATLMRDGQPVQLHFDSFVDRFPATGTHRLMERIHDPLVRVDNDIAIVWAPYEFLIDGKPDHCGTDVVNLVRRDGRWLIAGIADTSRKNCPAGA